MWTPITFERLALGHGKNCQYPRQETDNPCGSKAPEHHPASYQKATRRMVDGEVADTRAVYLCTNAMCAERIKLNAHRAQSSAPAPSPTGSPAHAATPSPSASALA